MKIRTLQILAAAFALAILPAPLAQGRGGFGGGGFHGGGGWHGGGGFYGGFVYDPWWGWDYPYYDYGYPYYGAQTQAVPATGSLVTQVQEGLAKAGYYRGTVDGIIGPMTRDAIARYQTDHHIPVTSRIDESLLQSLGLI